MNQSIVPIILLGILLFLLFHKENYTKWTIRTYYFKCIKRDSCVTFSTKKDITTNFGIEVIQAEIKKEEERIAEIENEYNYSSDGEDDLFDQ